MSKADKQVSILLPTYNRANVISNCIQSVISQNYDNWELIIEDDNSKDNTEQVCLEFCKMDDRIKYHKNPKNLGLPRNRNEAIKRSSGDMILFTEDDMVLKDDCLETLMDSFEEVSQNTDYKTAAISPSLATNVVYENKHRGVMDFARARFEDKLKKSPCVIDKWTGLIYRNFSPDFTDIIEVQDTHSCSLYPKNIFNELKYEESSYKGNYIGEESELHFKLVKMGYKLYFQPKAVMFHIVEGEGGCRLPLYKWSYYFIRNHSLFLLRNYGVKSSYMIPSFFLFILITFFSYYKAKI